MNNFIFMNSLIIPYCYLVISNIALILIAMYCNQYSVVLRIKDSLITALKITKSWHWEHISQKGEVAKFDHSMSHATPNYQV